MHSLLHVKPAGIESLRAYPEACENRLFRPDLRSRERSSVFVHLSEKTRKHPISSTHRLSSFTSGEVPVRKHLVRSNRTSSQSKAFPRGRLRYSGTLEVRTMNTILYVFRFLSQFLMNVSRSPLQRTRSGSGRETELLTQLTAARHDTARRGGVPEDHSQSAGDDRDIVMLSLTPTLSAFALGLSTTLREILDCIIVNVSAELRRRFY